MYLDYILTESAVQQELEKCSDKVSMALKPFYETIEKEVLNNLQDLVSEDMDLTYYNIKNFVCEKTIQFLNNNAKQIAGVAPF